MDNSVSPNKSINEVTHELSFTSETIFKQDYFWFGPLMMKEFGELDSVLDPIEVLNHKVT